MSLQNIDFPPIDNGYGIEFTFLDFQEALKALDVEADTSVISSMWDLLDKQGIEDAMNANGDLDAKYTSMIEEVYGQIEEILEQGYVSC